MKNRRIDPGLDPAATMAHQFVFTSLEKTMAGNPGFGVAGMSPGLPEVLRTRMQGLVSYEGTSSPQRTNGTSSLPPTTGRGQGAVNWFGLRIEVAARVHFILGRIGPTANDYSGRKNHIAHLLILDSQETLAVHPASLLREFPWMESWRGEARLLPVPVLPGTAAIEPASRVWRRLTGDGGYAGAAWDALNTGRPFTFLHEGLDDITLKELVVETLSQAPNQEAWKLRFATLAGDFAECRQSDLAGAVVGSRHADYLLSQKVPYITLSPIPQILPPSPGPWAAQARLDRVSLQDSPRPKVVTRTRNRPEILQAEIVENEPVIEPQTSEIVTPYALQQSVRKAAPSPKQPIPLPPPDPWRMVLPGGVGFLLGVLTTGILVAVGIYTFRIKSNPPEDPNADPAPGGNQKPIEENKKGAKDKPAIGNNANQEKTAPPAIHDVSLPAFIQTPFKAVRMMIGLGAREPSQPAEIEAQARMLRKFKNMDGLSVAEKDLLRPDRFWELARILQTAMPPLPDPFTDERINKLTTADAEDAWVLEVSAMVPFATRNHALAYLSLIANRDRIALRIKKIGERAAEDKNLAPHLEKIKESLEIYKNH